MIKRASDLVSKYVGETEQQMARMFEDATREGAVLLLDEADSFLQNRQLAVRNYEVTEVNEMLQGMERFDGIFICTTNLFDRIDEAALRRFSFKLRFLPLLPEHRERMFVAEALAGDASLLTDEIRAGLARPRPAHARRLRGGRAPVPPAGRYAHAAGVPRAAGARASRQAGRALQQAARLSGPVGLLAAVGKLLAEHAPPQPGHRAADVDLLRHLHRPARPTHAGSLNVKV